MIKLKSLFRRGPSGSAKQSNPNSHLRATSTSSLNSIGLSTASSSSNTTAVTPKSTKATLEKEQQIGSNDRFEPTFHESHESINIRGNSNSKLYSTSSGGESTSGFISNIGNSKSHSSNTVLSISPSNTPAVV